MDEGTKNPLSSAEIQVKLYGDGGVSIEGDALNTITDDNGRANFEVMLTGISPSSWITVRAEVTYRGVTGIGENFFLVRR